MKHEPKAQFKDDQKGDKGLNMMQAIAHAKDAVNSMTGLPIDSIVSCSQSEKMHWLVSLDVIESPARMGDNDLLATYEVQVDTTGNLVNFARLRRYHREDKDG